MMDLAMKKSVCLIAFKIDKAAKLTKYQIGMQQNQTVIKPGTLGSSCLRDYQDYIEFFYLYANHCNIFHKIELINRMLFMVVALISFRETDRIFA